MSRTQFATTLLAVALCGCGLGTRWSLVEPSGTEIEQFVLSETERFAGILHVKVRGVLTDDPYFVDCPSSGPGCIAAGWYMSGVAYYYRPWLIKQPLSAATLVAAHEVCHAISQLHDDKHKSCVDSLLGGNNG